MGVVCVRTYHLRCSLGEAFGFSQFGYERRDALLVEVIDDGGPAGWGECYGPAEVCQAAMAKFYGPRVIGEEARCPERVWQKLWQVSLDFARRGVMMSAISGLDMALWDLKGKLLGMPASELMGGRLRETVPCYATGMYFRELPEGELIEALVREAEGYRREGFGAMKIKLGRSMPFDLELIAELRGALPEAGLMADANHAYDLPEAVRVGRALDEAGYGWFEEPLSPEHSAQFRQLQEKLDLPIAAGECEQTRFGFGQLLSAGGVQLAQPDLAYCGGPSEGLKIRAIASSLGINVVPHAWGTMLNLAAAAHFLASGYVEPGRAVPAELPLECDRSEHAIRDSIFSVALAIEDGRMRVPTTPGLGVEVDRAAMEGFLVEGTEVLA